MSPRTLSFLSIVRRPSFPEVVASHPSHATVSSVVPAAVVGRHFHPSDRNHSGCHPFMLSSAFPSTDPSAAKRPYYYNAVGGAYVETYLGSRRKPVHVRYGTIRRTPVGTQRCRDEKYRYEKKGYCRNARVKTIIGEPLIV